LVVRLSMRGTDLGDSYAPARLNRR